MGTFQMSFDTTELRNYGITELRMFTRWFLAEWAAGSGTGWPRQKKISEEKSWQQGCLGVKSLPYGKLFISYVRIEPR
jgi:hypothetical protein